MQKKITESDSRQFDYIFHSINNTKQKSKYWYHRMNFILYRNRLIESWESFSSFICFDVYGHLIYNLFVCSLIDLLECSVFGLLQCTHVRILDSRWFSHSLTGFHVLDESAFWCKIRSMLAHELRFQIKALWRNALAGC